jgi:Holliday junction resolvasome RuvABC endonuclease subunit
MRVLSFDPGAKRMGWAVLQTRLDQPVVIESSYVLLERKEDYQPYRLRLLNYWTRRTANLLKTYKPDKVATEIVPPTGFGPSGGAIQAQLATAAITAVQVVTLVFEVPLEQISSRTMQKAITGKAPATKTKVRDGVIKLVPSLEQRRKEWTGKAAIYEEVDAIGVGLTAMGYKNLL